MNERQHMDEMFTGITPHRFDSLSSSTNNRSLFPYTWDDIAFNMNSAPFEATTVIIVTSYHGQLGWLKSTLTSYRKTGAYVILAYDNPCYAWSHLNNNDYPARFLPHPSHYLLAHSVVVKHKTYDADKRVGWFWDVWYAQGIIRNMPNVKHVYVTNGDCILEKPEGLPELIKLLGNDDLMSGQSEPRSTIHTADFVLKVDAFHRVMDYMAERNRHHVMAGQSPEALLRDAVDVLQLKEKFVSYPIGKDGTVDYYCTQNADSTWKQLVGFRNLYHEFEYCENNGLVPPFREYMDPYRDWFYFRDGWRDTICKFYDTGDRRYLMQFWDRGKDTDTDRKFLPLEAYGADPIYEVIG